MRWIVPDLALGVETGTYFTIPAWGELRLRVADFVYNLRLGQSPSDLLLAA